ncbi:hypothetical protein [Streptomyces erythrochromogenes]|uniref:hypothetical protein n=1 Tax=Streptomyces erythrochromogenes TaxID=285574 RepID=UPI00386A694F|nr:hypothetical protein OG364_00835 [Streptomyces erythrochromogenes]WST98381.1 hypothetical protein OG364_40700 [Streptomyces erythrochromogenes]
MSKRKKPGQQSRARFSGRRTVVVDLLEIGASHGSLTLRAGRDDGQLVCIVLPAPVLPSFMESLGHARLDAEEDYWRVIHHVTTSTPGNGPGGVPRGVEKWLLAQNWSSVLAAAADDEPNSLALISHVGHIGLRLAPPYTTGRALTIFDPLQFQRLERSLLHACHTAHEQAVKSPRHALETAALALRHISSQPWPPPAQPTLPSQEEAAAYMQGRYEAFQRRSPYIRADGNTLSLPSL